MSWIIIASVAYFLIAWEVILDKFLLSSKRVSHPAVYAFYSGILSLSTFILFPFGLHAISFDRLAYYFFPGIVFTYGILFLFFAIKKSEASRATPVTGVAISIFTCFLSVFIFEEQLNLFEFSGIIFLILGGILISWEFTKTRSRRFFPGFFQAVLAGALLAFSFTLFKNLYRGDGFINVFIWTRMGVTLGALSLLLIPAWKKIIFSSLANFKNPQKEHQKSGLLFVLTKILGGAGSIMLNFSISLGSVTVINAMISLEYTFIFILGGVFSFWMPRAFEERITWKSAVQKLSAIALITVGVVFISRYK